jgi:hypothetical protein
VGGLPAAVAALDRSYSEVLQRISLRTSLGISRDANLVWILGGALGAVLLVLLLARVGARLRALLPRRRPPRPLHPVRPAGTASSPRHTAWSFTRQAAALGLRLRESRNLRRLAEALSPDDPESLLQTAAGRASLLADIDRRLQRRQREVQLLQQLREKLLRMATQPLRERTSIRVEVDIPVTVSPHVRAADEGLTVELPDPDAPAEGRLLDLSEGGAALSTQLPLETGDVVEIAPAGVAVYWPAVTGGVVRIQPASDGQPPLVHLHFLASPPPELRALLVHLLRQAEAEPTMRN